MSNFSQVQVDLGEAGYPVLIGRGIVDSVGLYLTEHTKDTRVVIVYDSYFESGILPRIVSSLEKQGFEAICCKIDGGKSNKNFSEVLKIYGVLEENNIARDSTLIALGGGVIGDMAGFIASTWYRGMNLVHIPTTLMAMVDSSIGGKVAINFRNTINAVGNYYHPIINFMDLEFVDGLSDRDYFSGVSEVIKCALIADNWLFEYLEANQHEIKGRSDECVSFLIERAITIKVDHVLGDIREGGKRLLLNYGHTLGHSVEISTVQNGNEMYRHGEGVAIGMMAVLYIAVQYLNMPEKLLIRVRKILESYQLPIHINMEHIDISREDLLDKLCSNVKKDKKRINNKLRLILVDSPGMANVHEDVPFEYIEQAFKYIIDTKN
jgi:3-dehydroquinate synthase